MNSAIFEIEQALSAERVVKSPEAIGAKSAATIPNTTTPLAYVYPESAAEIQSILRIANERGLALWTCSRGKNWGYGSSTACQNGSVVMVLERMNRIIEVNEELAYAVIEPGVTYRQLNQYLKDNHLKLWADCTDSTPDGSVLGNAMDKGVGATPHGDHFGQICGMEVILPNGDLLQTGGGPKGHHATWNTYKWGTGPYLDGIFTQSNYGVVVKAGLWLMRAPEAFNSFTFSLKDEKNLPNVVDIVREMELAGILQGTSHFTNDICLLSILTQLPADAPALADQEREELRKKFRLPAWMFGGGIYGSQAQVKLNRAEIKKRLGRYGTLQFADDKKIRLLQSLLVRAKKSALLKKTLELLLGQPCAVLEAAPHIHGILKGEPTEYFVRHAYFRAKTAKPAQNVDPDRDGVGLIWFAPVAPMTGAHVDRVLDICRPLYKKHGFDFYSALLISNPRSVITLFSIFFDKENTEQTVRAKTLYRELKEATLAAGYQQYRTSVTGMDHLYAENPEFENILAEIKSALDPKNILSPGRYGIEPLPKETTAVPKTVPALLYGRLTSTPTAPAFALRWGNRWVTRSWEQFHASVINLAAAFQHQGLKKGDKIAVVLPPLYEWEIAQHAALLCGAVVVGIDPHASDEQLNHMLENSGAQALVVQNPEKLTAIAPRVLEALKFSLSVEKGAFWRWIEEMGENLGFADPGIQNDDAATLVYSSGTTGLPKPIVYTHGQIVLAIEEIGKFIGKVEGRTLCWLPLANLFQRVANLWALKSGAAVYFVENPQDVMAAMRQVEPSFLIGVPRLYEKFYESVQDRLAAVPRPLRWFLRKSALEQARAALGRNMKFMITGSAPTARAVTDFFNEMGVPLLEAYGCSENIVPMAMNTPEQRKAGTVGRPLPANQIRLSAQGEVEVKSLGVHRAASLTADGYYRTGDLGEIDAGGFLHLKGRLSDVIVTSTGRKVLPGPLEALYKKIPIVDQVVVCGNNRKQLVGLVTLRENMDLNAALQVVRHEAEKRDRHLPAHERIREWIILEKGLSVQSGELTSNFKLRRTHIEEKFLNSPR